MRRHRFIYGLAYFVTMLTFVGLLLTCGLYCYDAIHWILALLAGIPQLFALILAIAIVIREERSR